MPYGGEMNLLGGLMQGYVQGQMMNKRQAMMEQQALEAAETGKIKREELKLQQQMQKIKMMEMEQQAARQERLAPLTDLLVNHFAQSMQSKLGAQQAPTTTSSGAQLGASITGETAQPQGVADMAAMMQMLNHPMIAKMAEDAGIPGASRIPDFMDKRQQRANDAERLALSKIAEQRQQEALRSSVTYQRITNADGTESIVPAPTHIGLGQAPPVLGHTQPSGMGTRSPAIGGGRGMISHVKPDTIEFERDGKKYKQEVNPITRKPAAEPYLVEGEKAMSGESAGRFGMASSGLQALNEARDLLMPNGKLIDDWRLQLFGNDLPGPLKMLTPTGQRFNAAIEEALNSKARAETGASMNASEKPNIDSRFKPSSYDPEDLVPKKMDRLEKFLQGQIKVLDPTKKYSADTMIYKGEDGKQYAWEPSKQKKLDTDTARRFLEQAGGDKDKARKLAKEQGYSF